MTAVEDLSSLVAKKSACSALGISRAGFYRWHASKNPTIGSSSTVSRVSPLSLAIAERQAVLDVLHSPRFIDRAPQEIYATLLDEGTYLCSVRTMYRILKDHGEVRERRDITIRTHYQKPELLAECPNKVWSWDITKLKGPAKWTYFYLYVIMDIFSRFVVGWMVAHRESAALAKRLIEETCQKQDIARGQLTIHADRGSSMRSKPVAFLLADMGITKTHSRPYVSNDNPYSEAQFKTLKYCPEFPDCFGAVQDAREFCQTFFAWYNMEHRHSGIALMTPEQVHYGHAKQVLKNREMVLLQAYEQHPQRFKGNIPKPIPLPSAAWINKPIMEKKIENLL